MFQRVKPLVIYVPKYNWGIQTTCNVLQFSKEKQGSAISGVVERKSSEFTRERPVREPFKFAV